jgi:MFS family permease
MVVLGVIIFAGASALCGATPHGSAAETWLVAFRALQGLGGAIMFPAAIAIVVVTFDLRSRGRALALFFGIAGGLTAIGPIAGGFLIQWTWRSIFWINIPVALIALALIAISKPPNEARPAPLDYRGLVLIVAGAGLSVFGFRQSALWGWGNIANIPQFIRADFAAATREVLYGMCVIMAVAGFVALRGLRRGVQQEVGEGAGQLADEDPDADLYPAR